MTMEQAKQQSHMAMTTAKGMGHHAHPQKLYISLKRM